MIGKLKNTGPYNLVSLMVIMYISVGMPLLHSLFHHHQAHDHFRSAQGAAHFRDQTGHGKVHHCPICDFEAANQLHAAGSMPNAAFHEAMDRCNPTIHLFSFRTCSILVEARAPPVY